MLENYGLKWNIFIWSYSSTSFYIGDDKIEHDYLKPYAQLLLYYPSFKLLFIINYLFVLLFHDQK
jgi:hypothetical protein